jgi:stage III sporulation protein AE
MIRLCSLAVNGPRGRAWQKRVWRGFAGIQAGHGGRPARNSRWPQAVRAFIIICLVWLAQAAAPRCRGFAKAEAVESADALLAGAALEYVSTVDVSGIERFITDLDDDVAENMPEFNIIDIMSNQGADVLDLPGLAGRAASFLVREIKVNLKLLGELIVVAMVGSILCTLGSGLGEDGPCAMAWAVCYMTLVAMGIRSFAVSADLATGTIDRMMSFMHAIIPALVGLLAASGGVVTAAVVSPLMLVATTTVGTLVKTTVIPLLLLGAALTLTGNVSDRKQVTRLAGLLRWWSMTLLGLASTLFVAFMGVRGGLASVSDAASAKAAKFLAGSMIPVIGKVFGDALDLVASSSLVVRGALGAFGLVALVVVCLFPVLKMAAIMLMFRIAAAISQPLGDSRVADCLGDLADLLTSLCVSVATVGLMFFICISLVVGLGGLVVAIR